MSDLHCQICGASKWFHMENPNHYEHKFTVQKMSDHDKLTDEQLDELERLEKDAVKTPWEANLSPDSDGNISIGVRMLDLNDNREHVFYFLDADAVGMVGTIKFISRLRNTVLSLITELRELRKLRTEVEPVLRCASTHPHCPECRSDANSILARYFGKEKGE